MDDVDIKALGIEVNRSEEGEYWTKNGQFHREDGPAIIKYGVSEIWYLNGELHRDGGPAVMHDDGYQAWYQHDKYHREDGPSIITASGLQEWFKHDKRHRLDGPAIIWGNDNDVEWWVDHYLIRSPKQFQEITKCSDEHLTMLILKYGNIK